MSDELMEIVVKSPAFEEGGAIPVRYTADGEEVSPPLSWSGVPHEARSLVLLAEDPDAPHGVFSHWVLFNLPPEARELEEAVGHRATLPGGGVQGTNDAGKTGYAGPAPPPGKPHRYYFKLTALKTTLSLGEGARRAEVVAAMEGHVLAEGWLMGRYGRKER
jgi:Raf kinase inhibitor-like YbhB/YbcL family protein